jgi:hypothetical protein
MTQPRHRLADRLLLVTNLVVANVAAAVFVVVFLQPGLLLGVDASPIGQVFGHARVALVPLSTALSWIALCVGIGLLVWNFAWLVRRREQEPPSHWVVSDTPSGPVRIAREALETGLQKAGEGLAEVTRVRVQVDPRQSKRIQVTGQFWCAEGTNNLAASQRLRAALTDRLHEMVRPLDGARFEFDLEFQGFAGKLGKKVDVPPPEPPPFTGPKYPIDDEAAP